jgi:hypothetical protein
MENRCCARAIVGFVWKLIKMNEIVDIQQVEQHFSAYFDAGGKLRSECSRKNRRVVRAGRRPLWSLIEDVAFSQGAGERTSRSLDGIAERSGIFMAAVHVRQAFSQRPQAGGRRVWVCEAKLSAAHPCI